METVSAPDIDMTASSERRNVLLGFMSVIQKNLSMPYLRFLKREYGWTPLQFNAFCILDIEEGIKMSDIADKLGISRQQTTQLVNSMVEKGWVERVYDDSDRRNIFIRSTIVSDEKLKEFGAAVSEGLLESMDSMPEEKSAEILRSLNVISDWLKTAKAEGKLDNISAKDAE